jgi:hypothetical protein
MAKQTIRTIRRTGRKTPNRPRRVTRRASKRRR